MRLDFGERRDVKGWWWVWRDDGDTTYRFVPLPDRQFREYKIRVSPGGKFEYPKNWGEKLRSGSVVRVVLIGRRSVLQSVSTTFIGDEFEGCESVSIVKKVSFASSTRKRSEDLAKMADAEVGVDMNHAVESYAGANGMDKFHVKVGKRIVGGEDIAESL